MKGSNNIERWVQLSIPQRRLLVEIKYDREFWHNLSPIAQQVVQDTIEKNCYLFDGSSDRRFVLNEVRDMWVKKKQDENSRL